MSPKVSFHSAFLLLLMARPAEPIAIGSPDGNVRFELLPAAGAPLRYRIQFKNQAVIQSSSLDIMVDNLDLGRNAEADRVERYRINEKYAWRGVHSQAVNHCSGAKISLHHLESGTRYTLEVRAFNDGIAFRYIVPGSESSRIPDEATTFTIPPGSSVWYHDFEGHYEGIHARKDISEVQAGDWAAPPLTVSLPAGLGYASITEAALIDYAGMALQADEGGVFMARLGHAAPVSYPFRLRYGAEEGDRLAQAAAVEGTIMSPWRVIVVAADLNGFVNSDIIHNVSPPPDRKLFPEGLHTEWLEPGRSVWKYLDGGESTLQGMKEFSRLAGQLGFEYNLVEGFWQRWSEAELKELIDYSSQHKVKIWLWKHSRDIRDPQARRAFFRQCRELGVAGVKLDFFDHEAKEVVDLYQACLKDAAEFKLMVDFHGANKPAGEARTWPNEMTREGVRGLEYRRTPEWSRHNTTLPFTRFLAGHADYTPVHFGERRRETSWAHQIATAAVFTSPLLVYGAHPQKMLENPAVDVIKSIPSVWDETIVLPVSRIGEIACFARRRGEEWFLAILNGPDARTIEVPLDFLGPTGYEGTLVRDRLDDPAALTIEQDRFSPTDFLRIELRSGGGFIGRFGVRE